MLAGGRVCLSSIWGWVKWVLGVYVDIYILEWPILSVSLKGSTSSCGRPSSGLPAGYRCSNYRCGVIRSSRVPCSSRPVVVVGVDGQ